MPNLIARKKMIRLLKNFVLGRITNDEFEDGCLVTMSNSFECESLFSIFYAALWVLYSDMKEYKLIGKDALSTEERRYIARIILFLESDLDYRWPRQEMQLGISLSPIFTILGISLLSGLYFNKMIFEEYYSCFYLIGYVFVGVFSLLALINKGRVYRGESSVSKVNNREADGSVWPFLHAQTTSLRWQTRFIVEVGKRCLLANFRRSIRLVNLFNIYFKFVVFLKKIR